jgi:hypothetical protein
VDSDTVRKTDSVTVAAGSKGAGTLEINPDGTYRLTYWYHETVYKEAVTTGKWRKVAEGELFADKNAIELLDVLPNKERSSGDRKWFVWRNEDGSFEGRIPPHDFTGKIGLKKRGAASSKTVAKTAKPATPAPSAKTNDSLKDQPSADAAKPRTWTPDEVRRELGGKTKEQVFALLGEPVRAAYGTYYFNGVDKKFPHCPNGCNWKSFAIRFDGAGETASSIELQYWVVE